MRSEPRSEAVCLEGEEAIRNQSDGTAKPSGCAIRQTVKPTRGKLAGLWAPGNLERSLCAILNQVWFRLISISSSAH